MELDDLKQSWKQSAENSKPLNNNIVQMIRHKSYGPVATLKRTFRKQLIALNMGVLLIILTWSRRHDIFSDVLFWCYILFCVILTGYFAYGYRLMNKLLAMDGMVKENVEQQISILERSLKWRLAAVRSMLVIFFILMEVLMYFHQEPSLAKWYAQPLMTRLACYAGAVILFFFFTRVALDRKYGRHVRYLKELVQQMQ